MYNSSCTQIEQEFLGVIDVALLSVLRRWHFREGMPIREITRGVSRRPAIPMYVVPCALYVAAHSLVVQSVQWCSLKVWGIQLMKTKGHRRATVAVARKLAMILYQMWLNGTDFQYGPAETTT